VPRSKNRVELYLSSP